MKEKITKPIIGAGEDTGDKKGGTRDVRSKVVDNELADIVYVQKD